jgi:N-acetylglutamate synthase-like GNAT family acetyltransferase
MAVKIARHIAPARVCLLAEQMARVGREVEELTPRSLATIKNSLRNNCVIIAEDKRKIVGWMLIEPLSKDVAELGFVYVEPSYRKQGVFTGMIKEAVKRDGSYVLATYKPFIAKTAEAHGFRRTTLTKITLISRGGFITKRLINKTARKSVAHKMAQAKPLYLMRLAKK